MKEPEVCEVNHGEMAGVRLFVCEMEPGKPSIGGLRYKPYASPEEARADAVRLARAMGVKNALAAVPFAGAKAVLYVPSSYLEVPDALWAWAAASARECAPAYYPSWDMGMTDARFAEMKWASPMALGRSEMAGNPSPETARGIIWAASVALHTLQRASDPDRALQSRTILLQGLGQVGGEICRLLRKQYQSAIRLVGYESNRERAEHVAGQYGVDLVPSMERLLINDSAALVPDRIFVPCATGGVLDDGLIDALPSGMLVVSGANNPFADEELGPFRLAKRKVVSVPAPIANMGGVSWMALEGLALQRALALADGSAARPSAEMVFRAWDDAIRRHFLRRIETLTRRVLAQAKTTHLPAEFLAEGYARNTLACGASDVFTLGAGTPLP